MPFQSCSTIKLNELMYPRRNGLRIVVVLMLVGRGITPLLRFGSVQA